MLEGEVLVSNGVFMLHGDYESFLDEMVAIPADGLAEAVGSCLTIRTGIESGYVSVAVDLLDSATLLPEGWPNSSAFVIEAPDGELHVAVLFVDVPDSLRTLVVAPGRYAGRVLARGRNSGTSEEAYRIELWAA